MKRSIPRTIFVITMLLTMLLASIPVYADTDVDYGQKGSFKTKTTYMTGYTIYYPDKMGANGMKHPIITWGNGTGTTPSSYTGILQHLASYGFVVVASNTTNAGSGIEMIRGIDLMIAENDKKDSIFYQKLDVNAIGACGHSQGGIGAVNAAINDDRIKCSAPIQGTKNNLSSIKSPVFAIAGSMDTIVPPIMVKAIYNGATGPAVYGELQGATHFASVGPMPSKEILSYVTPWFILYLMNDNSLKSMFFEEDQGINADIQWRTSFKNAD